MTTKHTPGPFKAIQANCMDMDDEDDTRWSVVTNWPRQYFVATIENGAPGDTLRTEEANARLFAAAPDLLAACREAVRILETVELTKSADLAAIERILAAIARAEGAKP